MPAYIVADVDVHDRAGFDRYATLLPATIAVYGGRFVARGGRTEVLEGRWSPRRAVILEFPSLEKAKAWWNSSEYAEPKALRQASARCDIVLVEGV